jgi:mannosylglycerate hydrolase
VEINSYITLTSSAKRVDIKTVINNTAKSHRLRVCFPSCLPEAEYASAEVPFDVYDRPIEIEDTSDWREPAYSSHPQLGFVSLTDEEEGLTVINEGLTEYEVKDDNSRTVELTLIRAVGRSTGEDWDPDGSQCLGKHEFRYAIYPHRGGWETAKVFEQMLAHNTPIKATQSCRYDKGSFPREYSFIEISDSDIVLDCFKRAEDKDTLILRMHNPTDEPINTKIKSEALKINAARTVNFLEEPKEELEVAGEKQIEVEIGAKGIMTVELEAELRIKSALIDRKWNWFTLNEK